MKKNLLLLLPLLMFLSAKAQERQVTGTVIAAEDNLPIPGVNVVVEGTTKGTTTDVDGNFSLTLQEGENSLVFSFVGFASQTVDVSNQTNVSVVLQADVTAPDR